MAKVCDLKTNKRILITSINGLLGHCLFESMRNDHVTIQKDDAKPHRFLGTLNKKPAGGMITPPPSETAVKIIDSKQKPKTFCKQVRGSDVIVLDISQFSCDLEEASQVINALKYSDSAPEIKQTLIVISSPMTWSRSPKSDSGYQDSDFEKRVPLPKHQALKQLELAALALQKQNSMLRVHVVCSGFLYGNGEQNDIFYEFFRRAWVSLHPDLTALPVIAGGNNVLPTIHVSDLTSIIDLLIVSGHDFDKYLLAVDQS